MSVVVPFVIHCGWFTYSLFVVIDVIHFVAVENEDFIDCLCGLLKSLTVC